MNPENKLIEISNLTWWYHDSPSMIFKNFNFDLYKWDFCFVVGRSGVGKTTLVKFLIRQLKPPKKMIFYKKEDLARFGESEVQKYRQRVGVVFQDYKILWHKSVLQNIILPIQVKNENPNNFTEEINSILKEVGLFEKKEESANYLSGWEKQRVSIARALVNKPEFIIADEPTGNLDRENTKIIADILIDLHSKWHTILFISHDQRLIEYINTKTTTRMFEL